MTVQRILIVSGTHGNEINPVWAVKQFNREENSFNHGIEYEYIIGNPVAYEKGCRYIDVDLNRSFKETENFDQHKNNFYETKRANFLVDKFGIDGSKPCQIAIDLHYYCKYGNKHCYVWEEIQRFLFSCITAEQIWIAYLFARKR